MPKKGLDAAAKGVWYELKKRGVNNIKIVCIKHCIGSEKNPVSVGRELRVNGLPIVEVLRKEGQLFYLIPPWAKFLYSKEGCWAVLGEFFEEMKIPCKESPRIREPICLRDGSPCDPSEKPRGFCNGAMHGGYK